MCVLCHPRQVHLLAKFTYLTCLFQNSKYKEEHIVANTKGWTKYPYFTTLQLFSCVVVTISDLKTILQRWEHFIGLMISISVY